ncbi:hypothetical protein HGM15179_014900 [Zosterops borbonicus]|uniref:Uncharacterized protein n=1 Tax=Zosterops borbonicus TaxID=364589 RepID=A0A8K1G5C9_9PASS|nr:hypothetical protein HGM15179_014900 [Zosterops borbonicus]
MGKGGFAGLGMELAAAPAPAIYMINKVAKLGSFPEFHPRITPGEFQPRINPGIPAPGSFPEFQLLDHSQNSSLESVPKFQLGSTQPQDQSWNSSLGSFPKFQLGSFPEFHPRITPGEFQPRINPGIPAPGSFPEFQPRINPRIPGKISVLIITIITNPCTLCKSAPDISTDESQLLEGSEGKCRDDIAAGGFGS